MKTVCSWFIVVLTLLSSSISAQAQTARILYTSADLQTPGSDSGISQIINRPLNNSLIVRLLDGTTQRVPIQTVWGYVNQDGVICRRYKKDFFEIIDRKDSVSYKSVLILRMGHSTRVLTSYYYSLNLDSPIIQK